jgi:hypothetical protein
VGVRSQEEMDPNLFKTTLGTNPSTFSSDPKSDMATSSGVVPDNSGDNTDTLALKQCLCKYKLKSSEWCSSVNQLQSAVVQAEAHTKLAAEHIKLLKGQISAKQKKGKDCMVHIGLRIATSNEGLQESLCQKETRVTKAQQEEEHTQQKEDTWSAICTK